MNNKKQTSDKKVSAITWVVIAAVTMALAASDKDMSFPAALVALTVTALVIAIGAAKKSGKTGTKTAKAARPTVELHRPFPQPKEKQPAAFLRHRDEAEAEEAVSCHHVTGKEKYIQQLDSYLKAGLIDRNEYKIMKERYQKLEIPEDYH